MAEGEIHFQIVKHLLNLPYETEIAPPGGINVDFVYFEPMQDLQLQLSAKKSHNQPPMD